MLKVLILKSLPDSYIIGMIEELDEEPSLFIRDSHMIVDGQLEKWPKYTSQRDLFLTSDSIFTILDPSAEIAAAYSQKES